MVKLDKKLIYELCGSHKNGMTFFPNFFLLKECCFGVFIHSYYSPTFSEESFLLRFHFMIIHELFINYGGFSTVNQKHKNEKKKKKTQKVSAINILLP